MTSFIRPEIVDSTFFFIACTFSKVSLDALAVGFVLDAIFECMRVLCPFVLCCVFMYATECL